MMAYPPPTIALVPPTASPIRVGRFRHPRWPLYVGRLELFEKALTLQAWAGAEKRRIRLHDIEKVRIRARPGRPAKLIIYLKGADLVSLRLRGAMQWKYVIEDQCARIANPGPKAQRWSAADIPKTISPTPGVPLVSGSKHSMGHSPSIIHSLFEPAL